MKKSIFAFMAIVAVFLASGCTKSTDGNGRLVVSVTDAPFPIGDVESAIVTISRVELRKAGDGISDGNPFITVSEGSVDFDLIDLRNGIVSELANLDIPAGEYDLVRLYVDEAGLKVKDGDLYTVKVPSGDMTGIKVFIEPSLVVEGGLTSELLLDFDLSRSFIMRGNMDQGQTDEKFIFKPVIRAVNNATAGRIEGVVTSEDEEKLAEVSITVMQDDEELSTAFSDSEGYYSIIGITAGTCSIIASKEGFDDVTVDDIVINAGNKTIVDITLPLQE